jgi:putative inorganic carbon (hco3(-)) transporter
MLLLGVLVLIFLQIIRPQDFVPGLKGVQLVQYSMIFFLTLLLFSTIEKKPLRSPQDKFVGLFYIAIFLSSFTLFWITGIINTFLYALKYAIMYFFVVIIIQDEEKFKLATWTSVFSMWFVGLMGVLQHYGYDIAEAGGPVYAPHKDVWQIIGIGNFDNPNDLAYSVVLVVPFSLGLLFQGKGFLQRAVSLIFLSTSVYCIYLTKSRGGQLAFITGIAAWIFFWIQDPKWRRRILISGAVVTFLVFAFATAGYRQDDSAMGRIDAWAEGWQMLKSHPLIGVGIDQFSEHHVRDSHNSYVRAGAELGLIGLYAFIGILFYTATTIQEVQKSTEGVKWRPYSAGFGSFVISYIVASLFSTRTYDLVFLIVVALVGVLGRLALAETDKVSAEGVLFPNDVMIKNKNVFGLSTAVLIGWYLFLRQVW